MREILFRGKTDKGEWVEGYYVCLNGKEHRIYTGYAEIDCGSYYPDFYEVIPETIGQYTGLTDKNGNKIFEGDIVKHRSYYSDNIVISVVTYTDGQFLAMVDENSGFNLSDKLEIIGNIHDKPEVLKGGEQNAR